METPLGQSVTEDNAFAASNDIYTDVISKCMGVFESHVDTLSTVYASGNPMVKSH